MSSWTIDGKKNPTGRKGNEYELMPSSQSNKVKRHSYCSQKARQVSWILFTWKSIGNVLVSSNEKVGDTNLNLHSKGRYVQKSFIGSRAW